METPTMARLKEFGQWSEQISSSGKRYYYNAQTNISQWEKPTEWKQAERMRGGTNGSSASDKDKVSPTAVKTTQHRPSQSSNNATPPVLRTNSSSGSKAPTSAQIHSSSLTDKHSNSTPVAHASSSSANRSQHRQAQAQSIITPPPHPYHRSSGHSGAHKMSGNQPHSSSTDKHSSTQTKTPHRQSQTQSATTTTQPQAAHHRSSNSSGSKAPATQQVQQSSTSDKHFPQSSSAENKHFTAPGFREEKYLKFISPGQRKTSADSVDIFAFETKKFADRDAKQVSTILSLERDIHSIRTLETTAQLRTELLQQRLSSVRQRIQELYQ